MTAKTEVLFRWSAFNHYTISALIGLLDRRLDARRFNVGTLEHLDGFHPREGRTVLGYSFTSPEWDKVSKEIREFKSRHGTGIFIICGGPHVTARPREALDAGADAVFTGEAEESLPRFLDGFASAGPGRCGGGVIEPLPLGDFDDYPPFAYGRAFFGPIELRRGCLSRCSFCQTPRMFGEIRERSVEYVLKYSEYIRKAGRERVFFTISDALAYGSERGGVNLAKIEAMLAGLKSMGMKVHLGNFPSEISPRSLASRPEAVAVLGKYITNRKIIIGGQSASARVLGLMRRDHSAADVEDAVKILKSGGFAAIVDLMLGVPGERHEDREQTLEFARRLSDRYNTKSNFHYFMPLPGTPFDGSRPEPLEDSVLRSVRRMIRDGSARGDFFRQLEYSRSDT